MWAPKHIGHIFYINHIIQLANLIFFQQVLVFRGVATTQRLIFNQLLNFHDAVNNLFRTGWATRHINIHWNNFVDTLQYRISIKNATRAGASTAAEAGTALEQEGKRAPALPPSEPPPKPPQAVSTHAQTPTDSPSPAPAPLAAAVSPVATDSGAAAVGVQPVSPAPTTAPPVPAPVATDSAPARAVGWKDGTYSGWGTSRHGDVEATVIIENGRITAAAISRCLTRYSCSWIAHLQPQVVERQSPEVDNVSGATESANAFYYAVVEALKAAKR